MTNKKIRMNRGRQIRKATGLSFGTAMKAGKLLGKKFPLEMLEIFGDDVLVESYHCCADCGTVFQVAGFVGPKGEWRPS